MKRYITWLIIGEMYRKIPNEMHQDDFYINDKRIENNKC